jgi:predicted nucleic acid-binding protein
MDSCCFIELALQSVGKHEASRENDLWFLKELLHAAFDEEIEVLTSTLTIAECAHAKGDVSDDVKTLFKKFLTSGRYVFLVQDSVLVAEKARNLRWAHGLSFSGADSIHIASALETKCDEFITWDNKPHDKAADLLNLALTVCIPSNTHCLPDKYKQQPLITPATGPLPALPAPSVSQPGTTNPLPPNSGGN